MMHYARLIFEVVVYGTLAIGFVGIVLMWWRAVSGRPPDGVGSASSF
jgi:hypothetical protein